MRVNNYASWAENQENILTIYVGLKEHIQFGIRIFNIAAINIDYPF